MPNIKKFAKKISTNITSEEKMLFAGAVIGTGVTVCVYSYFYRHMPTQAFVPVLKDDILRMVETTDTLRIGTKYGEVIVNAIPID